MDILHEQIPFDFSVVKFHSFVNSLPHWHQRLEMLYLQEGELSVQIGNHRYHGRSGDAFLIHSGEIHHLLPVTENFALYVCTFNPSVLYFLRADTQHVMHHISRAALEDAGIFVNIDTLFQEMYAEKKAQAKWSDVIIQSDILRLYGLLARHFEENTPRSKNDLEKFNNFQTILSYISENYAEDITLQSIARQLNYTPAYVSRMFVTYAGINFKAYLDTIRINKAMKLIQSTDLTFSRIAIACGFANIRTFNNTFIRITGCAPSQLKHTGI